MAIVNTRTGLNQSLRVAIKTTTLRWMANNSGSGESNSFLQGSGTSTFGRSLNFVANRNAARELTTCHNTRFAAPAP